MKYIQIALFPIIYAMKVLLEFFYSMTGSYGIAIVFLSIAVSLLTLPISRYGKSIQNREEALQKLMHPAIKAAKQESKGEEQFMRIEEIYKMYNYHPIHSLKSAAGQIIQIPILLAALFLLLEYDPLAGEGFFFVADLGLPDALITLGAGKEAIKINLLPFLMSGISLIEVFLAKDSSANMKLRQTTLSLVLFALVYSLPSAVLLYWTSSNIISLAREVLRDFIRDQDAH